MEISQDGGGCQESPYRRQTISYLFHDWFSSSTGTDRYFAWHWMSYGLHLETMSYKAYIPSNHRVVTGAVERQITWDLKAAKE